MPIVSLEDARVQLDLLIQSARSGEEVVITQDSEPVAKIVPVSSIVPRAKRGSAKHLIRFIADDFDAPLDDFRDYS